jgi:quaternary ammonium compound-resistance protein SugE
MAWITLFLAGLLEIAWAYFMKQSNGFTRTIPTILTLFTMTVSFGLLSYSMRTLPLGTAYVVWTGIGAVGSVAIGVAMFGEPMSAARFIATLLILSGLVLMKSTANPH